LDLLSNDRLRSVTHDTVLDAVAFLRKALGAAYGGRDLLSAATKFLWLMHKDAVIIFDSQVRIALSSPPGDYAKYVDLWHRRYLEAVPRVAQACKSGKVQAVLGPHCADADAEWFRRRVFDIYLWNTGAPARAA
jgi:hypothetical protein